MVDFALCQSTICPQTAACGRHVGNGEAVGPDQQYIGLNNPHLTQDMKCPYFFNKSSLPVSVIQTAEATPIVVPSVTDEADAAVVAAQDILVKAMTHAQSLRNVGH
jgi:hypothetical protein